MDRERDASEPKVVGVGFQFHATPEELVDLARSWRDEHGLHLAAEHFFPDWYVFSLDGSERPHELPEIDRLALRSQPFDLTATSANAFTESNPRTLYLVVARLIGNELGEAGIGGFTSNPAEADLWRRLIRRLRAVCHKGATSHSWAASGKRPSHRHTVGAHRLAEQGVRMVAFPGGNEYTFDDISAQRPPADNRG